MNYENMLTLKSRIGNYDAGMLLDVAVGRGEFLKFAMGSFRSWQSAAGIDTDSDSLLLARKEFSGSPVILILCSALSMPFTDHYFDTITMSNTLHHIQTLPDLFTETARVVRPNGLVIINEMLDESLTEMQETYMLYHHFIADIDNQQGRFHREPFTLKELLSIIKTSPFQLDEYFIHAEIAADLMNLNETEAMSERLRKKVSLIRGTDYYYFYENKAQEIINRFKRTGIQRPRHVAFIMKTS
jgi:ubiquinone/menaquinone biosynthesis C-methylase UbiE